MEKLLVLSAVSDDDFAPVSMHLLQNNVDEVLAGAGSYAKNIGAELWALLPEGETVPALAANGVTVRTTTHKSPTLGNPYSVSQVLSGNDPRPMIQDGFTAEYEGKPLFVVTVAAAYSLSQGMKKFPVAVTVAGKTSVVIADEGASLADLVPAEALSGAKAVLLGGQKGEFVLPGDVANYKVKNDTLSTSVTVYGKDTCMVDTAAKLMNQAYVSSCGKCVLCREGTSQFRQIVTEMTTGKAKPTDIDLIRDVGELVCVGSYCPFGQNMPKPLLSAISLFPAEFEEHIKKKSCAAGVCYKAAAVYVIMPDLCTGCGDCVDSCDEDAIEGKDGFIHMIDLDMCENCGKCVSSCEENAIQAVTGKLPKLPKKLTKVGRF